MNYQQSTADQISKILRRHNLTVEQLSISGTSGNAPTRAEKAAVVNDIKGAMPHLSLEQLSGYINLEPSVISRILNGR